jgi:cyanophycin synthetase
MASKKNMEEIQKIMKSTSFLECTKVTRQPGYLVGMNQPSLIVNIKINDFLNEKDKLNNKKINEALFDIQPNLISDPIPEDLKFIPAIFYSVEILAFILNASKIPVFNKYLILTNENNTLITLALPSLQFGFAATHEALLWTIEFINLIIDDGNLENRLNQFKVLKKKISKIAPSGHNSFYFIKAAHESKIPWSRVVGNIFQFGWGSKARWLDSSFTDESANISARACRNKLWCSLILKNSGLPSSEHYLVQSIDQAISAAEKIKYPVVIKPVGLDGGVGVFASITNESLLRKYFDISFKISKKILIEKHVEGDDFRLQVYKDEVFWAVKRIPAGIVGDGTTSIERLIALKKIDVPSFAKNLAEGQALDYLMEQNFTLNYVPKKNEYIKLARRANVSSGGSYENVLADVHPDNLLLAIRAARAVRLDLAGVDIIMKDIKKSWLEVGATICEINAQPQIAPEAIPILTNRLITNDGRIPIILIIGASEEEGWINDVTKSLEKSGKRLGVALNNQLLIQGEVIGKPTNFYHASRILLNDNKVDMAIIWMKEYSLEYGLPFDRINKLILTDFKKVKNKEAIKNKADYLNFLKITDEVIVKEKSSEWPSFLEQHHYNFYVQNESNLISNLINMKF